MIRIFTHTFAYWLLLIPGSLSAQKLYGNEWINPSQTYLKIPVAKTGLYRITGQELGLTGIPVADIHPSSIQMFRRGKEIAIEISNQSPDKLDNEGYISFYGEKNDGAADSMLYSSPDAMPHAYYSLYSDTAAYFLTWRTDGGIGKRMRESSPPDPTDTIYYHFEESLQLFNSHYLPGRFYPPGSNFDNGSVSSDYDVGEGWTGPEIMENQSFEISFSLEKPVRESFQKTEIELLLEGWAAGNHLFKIWTGPKSNLKRKLSTIDFQDYQTKKIHTFLETTDLDIDGKVIITLVPVGKGGHVSVSYSSLKYPQETLLKNSLAQKLFSFSHSDNSLWTTNENADFDFYDCSDPLTPGKLKKNVSCVLLNGARKVLAVKKALGVGRIQTVNFKEIIVLDFDYLIVSHPSMHLPVEGIDPVKEYAVYRSSEAGGSYKPLIIHSSEIFDQFNYGDPGPLGIRNLISWFHQTGKLKFVFLIGRSVDPQKARKLSDARQIDMVPNAGWPGSDIALGMDPRDSSVISPVVPIGRLNALTSQNVYHYLLKVKAMEAEPASASWRKSVLHLSGGRSRDELSLFKAYVKSFEEKITDSFLGASVETISKQTDDPVEQLPVQVPVNKGASLITLFGHSSLDVTDIDIGYASDPQKMYDNHPHYPAIIVNGCASGSIFYSNKTLSSDWIFAPKTGAILFLAHTFNGVSTSLKRYTDIFYEVIADSAFTSRPFGNIQQEAIKRNMRRNPSIYDRITIQQMNLHGDPAIRISPAKLPDYLIDSTAIGFFDPSGRELSVTSDSILVRLAVRNSGRYRRENYHLLIQRTVGSAILNQVDMEIPAVAVADTLYFTIPNHPPASDQEVWKFEIDPENRLLEENKRNNKLIIKPADIKSQPFTSDHVLPVLMVTVDGRQLMNNDLVSSQPLIDMELFDKNLSITDTSSIVIWLKQKCQGCEERRISLRNATIKKISAEHMGVTLSLPDMLRTGSYLLSVQARDLHGNQAPVYEIVFRVSDQNSLTDVHVSPNPSGSRVKFTLDFDGSVPVENVELYICDVSGNQIYKETFRLHPGLNERIWDPGTLSSGTYLYRIAMPANAPRLTSKAEKALQGRLIWVR